ncbi:MAG: EAL domain-containing protein, partial [Deltaproteobacteria bacterium]
WADELASAVLRRAPEALEAATIAELAPTLAEAWPAHWARAMADGGVTVEVSVTGADGHEIPCELACRAVVLDGVSCLCAFVADISERELARQQFIEAEERYALAALGANDGLWDWDIARGSVVYSSRWASLVGFSEHELPRTVASWLDRVHPDDRMRVDTELASHLDGAAPHFESEHRVQHKDGTYRWVLFRGIAVRDAGGRPVRMAGSTADVTHRKSAEARLRFEAFHDPLTGLANRALLIRRVQHALESRDADAPADSGFAVVVVDIDDFNLVNDSLGHTLGDMLLRAVASRLKRSLRAVDTVARLGNDEFCLLLEHVGDAEVLRAADRIQEEMGVPFNLRGYEIYTSASLGVAFGRPGHDEAEGLLRDANIAMFRAKQEGRGRRAIFDDSMRRAALDRLTLETDLRRAVERNELVLDYQPIVSLATGAIAGFEALARWNHPKRGVVMPGDFIPLAEETGLIVPLGRWVLLTACEEAARWERLGHGPLAVSVNVSARQLALPYLVEQVAQVLEQTGLDPHRLNLEITESVLLEQATSVVAKLRELRRIGVGLHIDDFGTGYSSLAYLQRFPCDTLKIDKSFLVSGPTPEDDPWAIVQTIRSLARLLGMKVTVEGVERQEHVDRLRELGCEHAQGYFMSRPVEAAEIPALIAAGKRW